MIKSQRELRKLIARFGFRIERWDNRGKHIKVTLSHPGRENTQVTFSRTPTCPKAMKNAEALLKRLQPST